MTHASVNEGIQANSVQAEVIAVGNRAHASKTVASPVTNGLGKAVAELQAAIAKLEMPAPAYEVLQKDIQGLTEVVNQPPPDKAKAESHLIGIADKLKMVGLVLNNIVGLAEPAGKIAHLLRIPLTFLTGV